MTNSQEKDKEARCRSISFDLHMGEDINIDELLKDDLLDGSISSLDGSISPLELEKPSLEEVRSYYNCLLNRSLFGSSDVPIEDLFNASQILSLIALPYMLERRPTLKDPLNEVVIQELESFSKMASKKLSIVRKQCVDRDQGESFLKRILEVAEERSDEIRSI